jgi:hypothetical protein
MPETLSDGRSDRDQPREAESQDEEGQQRVALGQGGPGRLNENGGRGVQGCGGGRERGCLGVPQCRAGEPSNRSCRAGGLIECCTSCSFQPRIADVEGRWPCSSQCS